jgi:hypothetical protein
MIVKAGQGIRTLDFNLGKGVMPERTPSERAGFRGDSDVSRRPASAGDDGRAGDSRGTAARPRGVASRGGE